MPSQCHFVFRISVASPARRAVALDISDIQHIQNRLLRGHFARAKGKKGKAKIRRCFRENISLLVHEMPRPISEQSETEKGRYVATGKNLDWRDELLLVQM